MTRPKLYPNHQHQWADTHLANWVRCTVCDFEAPRNLAGLDGAVAQVADNMRQAHEFEETARQVETIINKPEPETP